MSSKAITQKRDDGQTYRWPTPAETAPSATYDTEPLVARVIGVLALAFLVFGGVVLILAATGRTTWVPPWLGGLFSLVGLGGLLFHAASEYDFQIRRVYMVVGFAWIAVGAFVSLLPVRSGVGSLFLPHGLVCGTLGLLFVMAFVRNETEVKVRDLTVYLLGGLGGAMAVLGFLFSNIYPTFLFSHGTFLIVLGAAYLWAFAGLRGVSDDIGYRAALGIGGLGLVFALVATVRSVLPVLAARGWIGPVGGSYFMPNGLLLLSFGLAYVALTAGLVSERPLVVMTRRELGTYFHSPVAYFMVLLFVVVAWWQFLLFVLEHLWDLTARGESAAVTVPEPMIRAYFFSLVPIFCVIFQVPVLTMRLLSEEQRTGTLEMTLTAPQEETTVILSKFLASLLLFLLTWAPFGLFLVVLRAEGGQPFDYQPMLAWLIVLAFTGAGFVSMGLFFSSLTKNQLTAAVLTFVGMLGLVTCFLIKQNRLVEAGGLWHKVLTRISFIDVWWYSLDGKLGLTDMLYHFSVAVFWLFLSVKVLESRKWR